MRRFWIIVAMAAGCLAQDGPTFEVASIKPFEIAPGGGYTSWSKGGPGTNDPTRIDYHNVSLSDLISRAYAVEYYQLVGPDWLMSERYQLAATVAKGTNKEQFQAMFRNLLIDRFKLRVHRDQKEMERYSLTMGKGGPKLKQHIATPEPETPQSFGSNKTCSKGRTNYESWLRYLLVGTRRDSGGGLVLPSMKGTLALRKLAP